MTLRVRVEGASGTPSDYTLDGDQVVIGRAATAAIVIADERVSRQHARFVQRDGAWWIEDLGARNRTVLNGAPVREPSKIRPGDRLEVGDVVLRIFGESGTSGATTIGGVPDAARMWTINEIHRALAAPLSLTELLDVMLARCFDVLDPEEGLIMLRGADGAFAAAATRRRSGDPSPVVVPRRLLDEVAGKGQPALVFDAAYDDRFAGSASMVASGIRSIVAAPIGDADGVVGLITLCSRAAVRQFAPSDLDMLVSIAGAAALRVRNAALVDELAARRVIEHELQLAHDVQMAMLPRAMPSHPGLQIAAALKPARSVGGDLYDVVLDGDRLWFIVADVAGKSIAAALYMAIARALFRATVRSAQDVADVAARMNQELARDNDRLMFVTAAIGCLTLSSRTVTLVDAGHTPPLVLDAGGVRVLDPIPKGIALGALPSAAYIAGTLTLPREATLFFYTDGVTDARSPSGESFGDDRLLEVTGASGATSVDALVTDVMSAVATFSAGALPDDDVTVLALRYAPGCA